MKRLLILLGWSVFLALAAIMPVRAGDETCRPEPLTAATPSGIAGCSLDGPTRGKASRWNGSTVAAQWCVYEREVVRLGLGSIDHE